MFCKTCGVLLILEKNPYGKWLRCPEGHIQPETVQQAPIITSQNYQMGKKITVADDINILAVHDHLCKKCGHDKAELLEMSAAYSDEDNIYRMKCGKCRYVEQLEGKVK